MNLGKPRRRLQVAQRPGIDIDAQVGSDDPAETSPSVDASDERERESAPRASATRAARDGGTNRAAADHGDH
jgi:hypothetical protein